MAKIKKTNVLKREIIAATFPFESAVKSAAEKMLVPVKKKEIAKM